MKITQLHACVVRVPQKPPIAPYQNRYKAQSEKESVLIRLETDTGLVGWGENPVDWINKTFEGAPEEPLRRQVLGRDPFDLEALSRATPTGSGRVAGGEQREPPVGPPPAPSPDGAPEELPNRLRPTSALVPISTATETDCDTAYGCGWSLLRCRTVVWLPPWVMVSLSPSSL